MFEPPRWFSPIALLIWFVSLSPLPAQEAEPNGDQLMFVPPPVEGVISLGVYDSRGKLLRVLKRSAELESFKSGLDGLIIDWDRTDSQNKPVPNGKYFARGVLTGDVKIEGVAFHLNDWIDSSDGPRIRKIVSATLLKGLRAAILADASQPQIVVFDSSGARAKTIALAFRPLTIKALGPNLLVFDNSQVVSIDASSGAQHSIQNFSEIRDADASGDRVIVLGRNQIRYSADNSPQELKPPAEDLCHCTLLSSSILVASRQAKLWKLDGQEFVAIDPAETGELLDMGAGVSDSAWLLVKTVTTTVLKQIDSSGQNLREIELPPELQTVTRIGGSRNDDALFLIGDSGGVQRVVGIRFQLADQRTSVWKKWFDRTLTAFKFFDLKDGKVVPAETKTDSPPVFVKPANNPMENTRQPLFQLIVMAEPSGAWVATIDGLPLFQVCGTKEIKQTLSISDGANGMRVYISDGTVVEEYHLTSLQNLFRFDAGSFD